MEEIKGRLTEHNFYFLKKMEEYIENKLIFFGSIKRCDYIQENSDIDIVIISDNVKNTISRLKNFLNIDNNKIRRIFQKLPDTSNLVYGYKTNYDDENNNLSLEIIIYDSKYKESIMKSVNNINNFPFYLSYTLLFIKLLYYKSNIISTETYKYIKKLLMENYLNQDLHDNLIAIKI